MLKTILPVVLFVFVTLTLSAQNKTYFTAEATGTNDVYKINDAAGNVRSVPLITGAFGVSVRQDLSKYFFIEAGLLLKLYDEGVGFHTSGVYTETNAMNAWFIPLRFGSKINLHKNKIYLVPAIGFTYAINSDYSYGDGGGAGTINYTSGRSEQYTYISHYDYTKTYPLIEGRLGIEFKLFKTALLSFSGDYYGGFKRLIQQDIIYKINNEPEKNATKISKGSCYGTRAALSYSISNIWSKTKH